MFNRIKRISSSKKGFTLVEVLVASAISSIILIGTLTLVLPTMDNIRETSQINDAKMISDQIIQLVAKEIKYADNVLIDIGTAPTPGTDETTLFFEPHDPLDPNSVLILKRENAGGITNLISPDDYGPNVLCEILFNVDNTALSITINSETLIGQNIYSTTKVVKNYNGGAVYESPVTADGINLLIS